MNRSYLTAGAVTVAAVLSFLSLTHTRAQDEAGPAKERRLVVLSDTAHVFDYKVIQSVQSGSAIDQQVVEWQGKGYRCQGGVTVDRDTNGGIHYYQAMVK